MSEQIAESIWCFVTCLAALQFDDGLIEAQGDDGYREKIEDVLQVENAALEVFQMRHDAEFRDPCGAFRVKAPFGEEKGCWTMST